MHRIIVLAALVAALVFVPGLLFGPDAQIVVTNILIVLLGVGFIIFVHELGHFLTAKWVGAKVHKFYLGFGPTVSIFGKKVSLTLVKFNIGETEYGIGAIMFGGFVEIDGQDATQARGKPYELMSKTPGQRALVFAAGAIMNAVFGFLFFIIAFTVGVSFAQPEVGGVTPETPAWKAGIKPGDKILSINGRTVDEFGEFGTTIALMRPKQTANIKIERNGKKLDFDITPVPAPGGRGLHIGVSPAQSNVIETVIKNSPADNAGLLPGDEIIRVVYEKPFGGDLVNSSISSFDDFRVAMSPGYLVGRNVSVILNRAGEGRMELTMRPVAHEQLANQPKLGIEPATYPMAAKGMRVSDVVGNPSESNEFKPGDTILSIEGRKFEVMPDLRLAFPAKTELQFKVTRTDGTIDEFSVPADEAYEWLNLQREVSLEDPRQVVVARIVPGSPAEAALNEKGDTLMLGDVVTSLNGKPMESWIDFSDAVNRAGNGSMTVGWKRGDKVFTGVIAPALGLTDRAYIGVTAKFKKYDKQVGPIAAVALGWERTVLWGKRVFLVLRSLTVDQTVSSRQLAGPIGIAHISYKVLEDGLGRFIYILALISVNLAIVNLIPFPILDGGHLLFLLIEKIKGSPVSVKVQGYAFTAGAVLLIAMFLYVTFNDITRFITGF